MGHHNYKDPMNRDAYNNFNDFRWRNQFCDVNIRVGDVLFPAHRVILASRRKQTNRALRINFLAHEWAPEIVIRHMTPSEAEAALQFIYKQRRSPKLRHWECT